jgi:hypothetical protein
MGLYEPKASWLNQAQPTIQLFPLLNYSVKPGISCFKWSSKVLLRMNPISLNFATILYLNIKLHRLFFLLQSHPRASKGKRYVICLVFSQHINFLIHNT